MLKFFNAAEVDIEDAVDNALAKFKNEHNKVANYLVIGRMAYEELRDMVMVGHRNEGIDAPRQFRGLTVCVLEEPADLISIGCKPD